MPAVDAIAQADESTLIRLRDNLTRGVMLAHQHVLDGTFHTPPKLKAAPPRELAPISLALLHRVDSTLVEKFGHVSIFGTEDVA